MFKTEIHLRELQGEIRTFQVQEQNLHGALRRRWLADEERDEDVSQIDHVSFANRLFC